MGNAEKTTRLSNGQYVMSLDGESLDEMNGVVFYEPPRKGDVLSANDVVGTLESSKAVYEIHAPFDCEVLDVTQHSEDDFNNGKDVAIALLRRL